MIAEIGHFALILALVVAGLGTVVPLWGVRRNDAGLMAVAAPAAILQFFLTLGAFAALTVAYVTSDFSVQNVFENSHTDRSLTST